MPLYYLLAYFKRAFSKMCLLIIVYFTTCSFSVLPIPNQAFYFQPLPQDEYLQAWNYTFHNKEVNINIIIMITNLGPGNYHNAVALYADFANGQQIARIQTHPLKGLIADKKSFYYKNASSSMKYRYGKFEVSARFKDVQAKFYLPYSRGYSLTGGKKKLPSHHFLQADSIVRLQKIRGYLIYQKKKWSISGKGHMEHLLTNHTIRNTGNHWQIYRGQNKTRKLILGGYKNGKQPPFYSFFLLDHRGKMIDSGRLHLKSQSNQHQQNFITDKKCSIRLRNFGKKMTMDLSLGISVFLRYFVKLFFSHPYLYRQKSQATYFCKKNSAKWKLQLQGIHTSYLIK